MRRGGGVRYFIYFYEVAVLRNLTLLASVRDSAAPHRVQEALVEELSQGAVYPDAEDRQVRRADLGQVVHKLILFCVLFSPCPVVVWRCPSLGLPYVRWSWFMCSSRMQNVRGETAARGSHGKVEVGAMVYATRILASSQSCRIEQWTRHSLLRTRSRAQLPNDCPPLYHAPKQIDRSPPGFLLLPSSAGASVYSNVVSHSILF